MSVCLDFPYDEWGPVQVPRQNLIAVLAPNQIAESRMSERETILAGLEAPIGSPKLTDMAVSGDKVMILVDDYTRTTPTHLILPEVIGQLKQAGVSDIKLLIAYGTHRVMTAEEKIRKYGKEIVDEYEIIDHHWDRPEELVKLPATAGGTEVLVNRHIMDADLLMGIGHIVPHRVAGFSGGAKIVQPGVCGAETTGQTHWLSAELDGDRIMGRIDNPIRREMNAIGRRVGLKFIINTIHDGSGKVYRCVCGDPVAAFEEGCRTALDIYGVSLAEQADIVIVEAFPADAELWQACKGIFSADLALAPGGVMILVSPCMEGVSVEHPEIEDIGYRTFRGVEDLLESKRVEDLTLAAHIAHVGRVVCDKGRGILVTKGIDRTTAEKIGFLWAEGPQEALNMALEMKGQQSRIVVLKNGGEIMPIIGQ